jgi:hypothetical protein
MEVLGLGDIIKIGAGSGVVAAIFGSGISWLKEGWQRKQQLTHDAEIEAIHLISKLDAVAVQCAKNFWAFQKLRDEYRANQSADMKSCVKPALTLDVASVSKVDRAIACRIAWLENEIQLGDDEIMASWEEYLDTDDAYEADADLVGHFGYEALMIAKDLRSKYNLTHQGTRWGMPKIERQLSECSERMKKNMK